MFLLYAMKSAYILWHKGQTQRYRELVAILGSTFTDWTIRQVRRNSGKGLLAGVNEDRGSSSRLVLTLTFHSFLSVTWKLKPMQVSTRPAMKSKVLERPMLISVLVTTNHDAHKMLLFSHPCHFVHFYGDLTMTDSQVRVSNTKLAPPQ